MSFPPFSDYQDTFLSALPPSVFASYTVPSWIPAPANLVRIARAIYPYWRERRMERGGHRIISTLNVGIIHSFLSSILKTFAV
jgi:enhancer of polycomb-like protein